MGFSIKANGTALPSGVTEFKRGDELLWSDGTGRGAASGKMIGTVVASKQTYSVTWGMLTNSQYNALRNAIPKGFFTMAATSGNATLASITAYRGSISGTLVASLDADYWKDVKVDFVER